jgi:hypothetical protein
MLPQSFTHSLRTQTANRADASPTQPITMVAVRAAQPRAAAEKHRVKKC